MKVVIDARFYGIAHTGIGRYVENLITHLNHPVTLIVNPSDYSRPELNKFPKVISYTHPYSILSQFEIPLILLKLRPSVFHSPFSSIPILWPGKIVVTFHDLIKHQSKGSDTTTHHQFLYWLKYYGYLLIDFISAKRASAIITPTKYWQNLISKKYNKKNIFVTYEAVDNNFIKEEPQKISNLKTPFLVHTGNLYPHKNINVVFQALKNLDINLYLICARSVFAERAEEQIKKLNLQNKVFFLGRLSDAQTKFVYSKADALVFPSKVEGFGLNGLEAMSVGLPVISSNASCLPEVYGNAALYFDPDSPDDLVKQINLLAKERQTLVKLSYEQVKKYSWVKMAKQTWDIYQSV